MSQTVTLIYNGKEYKVPLSYLINTYNEAERRGAEKVGIPLKENGKETYLDLTTDELGDLIRKAKSNPVIEVGKPKVSPQPPPMAVVQPQPQPKPAVSGKSGVVLLEQPKVTSVPKEVNVTTPEEKTVIKKEVTPLRRGTLIVSPKVENERVYNTQTYSEYSPTFIDVIRNRVRYVFSPLFSNSTYREVEVKSKYKPRLALKRKTLYKPKFAYSYSGIDYYEPHYKQVSEEDFAPKDEDVILYNPETVQEAYPVFTYATYGVPDTYVDQYAPEESVKIKPVTEFTIRAKPKPLIVSKAHLILLNKLLNEVV